MAQPNHLMGKWRQDEWMEEDDLLGGELGQEQDLRAQLQRGGGLKRRLARQDLRGIG